VTGSTFTSVATYVAWRNLRLLFRTPALLVPALLFPLFFLIAFAGALSSITEIPEFGGGNYTAFQYVFALLQSAAFTGAMGGFAIADDWESGFMRRLMLSSSNRLGIVAGYVLATFVRCVLAAAVLTAFAFLFGMEIVGSPLEILGLVGLTILVNVLSTLWAAGVAMRVRSFKAAPGMFLPLFILLFLAPVFVPLALLSGWLHAVATANPMTYLLEAGRGLIAGEPVYVGLAYGIVLGLTVLAAVWAITSTKRAEADAG
jgi:ABC-2 type transport system permease protein